MDDEPKGREYSKAEVLADTTVHVVGVVVALVAVPVMVTLAAVWRTDWALITAISIYGATLVAMLTFSASYNLASAYLQAGRLLDWLRRLDHGAIYLKIAGTYTPYAVIAGGPLGRWLLVGVWSGAAVGLGAKLFAPGRWERALLFLYLALGWCFVLVARPVSEVVARETLILIVVGGLLYTVGVMFFLWEKLPFQNAIWHLFVLTATCVFYSAIMVEIAQAST